MKRYVDTSSFFENNEGKLGFRYPSVTADSGYESEERYTYLREQNQQPYIKPQTYEKWKKRSFKTVSYTHLTLPTILLV